MTIEETERVIAALENIAEAFALQNQMNLAWIVEQREWHTEDIGPSLVAIHEQDAQKNEDFRNERREMIVAQIIRQDEMYLEQLTQQKHVLAETIDALCEKAGVEKPEWNG
jgi:hypothetical protein